MKFREKIRIIFTVFYFGSMVAACTMLQLEDDSAPSLQASIEADYDLIRWGAEEKSGWAATPPNRKKGGDDWHVNAFRIRGQFSGMITGYDAEGTLNQGFFTEEKHLQAEGQSYRGRVAILPGFSFGGGNVFIAALFGLESVYMENDLINKDDSSAANDWMEFGLLGAVAGAHVEVTLNHLVTPIFTHIYAPTITTWGSATEGTFSCTKIGMRFWPGSVVTSLGSHVWIEGGWQWSAFEGSDFPNQNAFEYELFLSGIYGAFGYRF